MRLYDFSFKTGVTFEESYSPKNDTNYQDYYLGGLALTSPDISGLHYSRLNWNGQTLVEQKGVLVDAGFDPVYLNSGDYYFRSGEDYRNTIFNSGLSGASSASSFSYNLREDFRESPVGTGENNTGKQNSLNSQLSNRFSERTGTFTGMNSFDYFTNGQKIYSGVSGSYRISGASSLFYYDDNYLGKVFAILKNSGLKNTTGETPDIYNQKYVEKTVFGHLNGLALHKKNWLELSTGVTLIRTGLQSSIFEPTLQTETIQL
jgi:hypothetical protein